MPRAKHHPPAGPWSLLWREGESRTYGMQVPEGVLLYVETPRAGTTSFLPGRGLTLGQLKARCESVGKVPSA